MKTSEGESSISYVSEVLYFIQISDAHFGDFVVTLNSISVFMGKSSPELCFSGVWVLPNSIGNAS